MKAFRRTYRWNAQVEVDLPAQLGGERRLLEATGSKTLEFSDSGEDHLHRMKLVDQTIRLERTQVFVQPHRDLSWLAPLEIAGAELSTGSMDCEGSNGFVDARTGEFTLAYRLTVDPETFPFLRPLGTGAVPLVIHEGGVLDLSEGASSLRSSLRFFIDRSYEGPLDFRCFGKKCKTQVHFCATVDRSECRIPEPVIICPGEEVTLNWVSSPDVTSASITPDVGNVQPTGSVTVRPQQTTDYAIEVTGDCNRDAKVKVHVVQPGDVVELAAGLVPYSDPPRWETEFSPQFVSPQVAVTSIEPKCGAFCMIHEPPVVNHPYLDCGSYLCNAHWSALKVDVNGSIHNFTTMGVRIPIPQFPLAGTWTFVPLAPAGRAKGTGYFDLTVACRG